MLKTRIIAVGKLHEPWKTLAEDYEKRLGPFLRIAIREVAEERFRSANEKNRVLKQEGALLARGVPEGASVVALTERGNTMDTPGFVEFLKRRDERGEEIAFLIGGPLGIDPALAEKADFRLSLSPLTFTHEMARVILLEQLYRSATIMRGKTYHY